MKRLRLSLITYFIILSGIFAYSQESTLMEIENIQEVESSRTISESISPRTELDPYHIELITEDHSSIQINTDVKGASVYINGNYKGTTPLTISGLYTGTYDLEIRKKGYEPIYHTIRVQKGKQRVYSLKMHKLTGRLIVNNAPAGSLIYVDGTLQNSNIMRVEVGYHRIKIRKFGYYDASADVLISPHFTKVLSVNMQEQPFSVTGFYSTSSSFNPNYESNLGHCSLTLKVTNNGSGTLSIYNKEGQTVYSNQISSFNTWDNYFTWDGRSYDGAILPDGKYTATFETQNQKLSATIQIDSTIKALLSDITAFGSGIGTLLNPRILNGDTIKLALSVGPEFSFSSEQNGFYSLPLKFSIAWAFSPWCEFSSMLETYLGQEEVPVIIGASLKFCTNSNLTEQTKLCYGASISYNFTTDPIHPPYGSNNEYGFGIAGAMGIEARRFYLGFASQYILGSRTGSLKSNDFTWQNGITATIFSTSNVNLDFYASLDSFFYTPETNFVTDWIRCIESGASIKVLLNQTSNYLTLGAQAYIFPESSYNNKNRIYIGTKFGTTFIF